MTQSRPVYYRPDFELFDVGQRIGAIHVTDLDALAKAHQQGKSLPHICVQNKDEDTKAWLRRWEPTGPEREFEILDHRSGRRFSIKCSIVEVDDDFATCRRTLAIQRVDIKGLDHG